MKKLTFTIEDLFNLPTAVIYNPDSYKNSSKVFIDSREVEKNSIFIAVKGLKFDGHNFINEAVSNGATTVIINEKKLDQFDDLNVTIITVKDTTKALGHLASLWREKLECKVIGITGSTGKTSTKDILAALLSTKFSVNKTIANNNNHIGVPLTILSTKKKHDFLIAELGTNHPGEIKYTADILQPDFALITNIGDSHIEFLKNRKGVLKEKGNLFKAAKQRKGILFVNKDDKLLSGYEKGYKKRITYGINSKANVKAKVLGYDKKSRAEVKLNYNSSTFKVKLPIYGIQAVMNYLAAVSIALEAGLTKKELKTATKKLRGTIGRLNVIEFEHFTIVDDTYNSNPESTISALEMLRHYSSRKRKIALLGDMFELGKKKDELHKKLAAEVKKNKVDELYTIGPAMRKMNYNIVNNGIAKKHFNKRETLKKFLSGFDKENSIILVKGSRGMKMEEFLEVIKSGSSS